MLTYFKRGFSLANKTLTLYLGLLGLTVISDLISTLSGSDNTVVNILSIFISLIIALFYTGFILSLPAFLLFKQQDKLQAKQIFQTTMRNTKRILLPTIIISVLAVIVLIMIVATTLLSSNPQQSFEATAQIAKDLIYKWNIYAFAIYLAMTFFAYTSIYFSIEKQGFWKSLIQSISTSLKNLKFLLVLMLLNAVTYTAPRIIFGIFNQTTWERTYIWPAFIYYVDFILTASVLYYYQQRISKK